ncbi:molybdopterin-dependent oxidoreductase [Dermatobacter hominis]|uniref:molybdopterin-dependent oxidoreductase n=1 Tax=Dermatobacter hominis TaxID=2884263 RepID=UPI001D11D586|nr:molybdopterin-dependent oxidoreductase [Dermatobacter hominis]UDY33967.1 molybdopterin-dependent oxidoreductase [Dermatobacter hominis]
MTATSTAPRWAGALVGVVAAGVGVAVGELVAGTSDKLRGPIVAVGDRVVDNVPPSVKDWAISTFGTNDKAVLLGGVTVLLAVFAAVVGIVAVRRSLRLGLVGVGVFALVGVLASFGRGGTGWARPAPPIIGGLVAGWALVVLTRRAREAWPPLERSAVEGGATDGGAGGTATAVTPPAAEPMVVPGAATDRRRFLVLGAGLAGTAVVAGGIGRWLQGRAVAVAERLKVVLPTPSEPLPAVPASVHAEGAVPFITPNDDFYRIDTALVVPRVSTEGWELAVKGRVERPLTLTYRELLDRPMIEADITISCVSNEVGGDLIGTARWLGCRLDDLLDEAGIDPSADQVVGRSVDGFTAGFPTALLDGRPALVAVGMNGEALPIDHGYPARLVVPGVYGYVSATKWLSEIELTRFDEFEGYWIPRGWSQLGPIKTQSRIDTPESSSTVEAGADVPIAGVAWAMDRRIAKVEIQVDDGEWQETVLADEHNDTTWRQWRFVWRATPGQHRFRVRATDGTGETQTADEAPVAPDGATGWDRILLRVE